MPLRRSSFVHQIPVGDNRVLVLHAIQQTRFVIEREVSQIIDDLAESREMPQALEAIRRRAPYDEKVLTTFIQSLIERGILTEKNADEELAELTEKFGPSYGRDPTELLDRHRRLFQEGAKQYWTAVTARGVSDLGREKKRLDIVLYGDCDVHMESDFLRRAAEARGFDLRVAATSPDDFAFVHEHKHDAIIIGALFARHFITAPPADGQERDALYISQARHILKELRSRTEAPILIDALPEPTVQPLGLAERGSLGHRQRFRHANMALLDCAEDFGNVHVVDTPAVLAAAGTAALLDDAYVGFTHMGSSGWLLQRPESELVAVHGSKPDLTALAAALDGDPYRREAVMAEAHMDMLVATLGLDRKKCVIVDLDGTLWPGVLAETGKPFAWEPQISGVFSFVGLFFGLHEALLCLKKRGIVLACVSKNDEATVRELWRYPDFYPRERLLTMDDFVTHRINWQDKVENIRSIADELGFADGAFLFIDDHPVERDRVRQRLPEIEVWGEDLTGLRKRLLSDPRLQVTHITDEAAQRTDMVKAQLGRQRFRKETLSEADYIKSLAIEMNVEIQKDCGKFDRIEELFRRTTQFNATGKIFTAQELGRLLDNPDAMIFAIHVRDRFGDHGLTGAAVAEGGEITGLVLSCRVLGMGVEHEFMCRIVAALHGRHPVITGRIIPTARNIPVRNIYRDHGFMESEDGVWRLERLL